MQNLNVNLVYKLNGNFEDGLDVFELAPILLSIGELVRESNRIINPGSSELGISIKPFQEGSFIIDIVIFAQNNLMQLVDVVNNDPVQQTKNVLEWVGIIKSGANIASISVFGLIRWLKGKPKKISQLENGYQYTNIKGETVMVPKEVHAIYNNCVFQKTINNGITRPLSNSSVETIKTFLKDEIDTELEISKDELSAFNAYVDADLSDTNQKRAVEVDTVLNLIKIVFEKDRKWDFIYNGNKISATITDPDFYDDVLERKYSFTSGDTLEVRLQIFQEFDQRANTYINRDYKVIKVNKHIPVLLQVDLF
jgi:hypothetical protein